eukprot:jgi/Astpho2/9671/e_gw1.00146.14.1_t
MHDILSGCISQDNNTRQQAEQALAAAGKKKQLIPAVLECLARSNDDAVQQLAGVVIRKRVSAHWKHLDNTLVQQLKQTLQAVAVEAPQPSVRRSAADAIIAVAKLTLPTNQWPDLLPWLLRLTDSQTPAHRQTALRIIAGLAEVLGAVYRTVQQVLLKGLADDAQEVRLAAVSAMTLLVPYTRDSSETNLFKQLVPAALKVGQHAVESEDEEVALVVFDLFIDILEGSAQLLGPHLAALVQWCMSVASNTQVALDTRGVAAQVLAWAVEKKPKQVTKQNLVRPLLHMLLKMTTEPDEGEKEDDEDDEDAPARKLASQVIDTMSLELKTQQVFPDCLQFAQTAVPSPNPWERRAAMLVLLVVAEGCAEACSKSMGPILQLLGQGMRDADAEVRGDAVSALSQMAEHCTEGLAKYHTQVVPALIHVLQDKSATQQQALFALETLCEDLGEDLLPYLDPLVAALMLVLQHGEPLSQRAALATMASAASAVELKFKPHAAAVMPLLQHYMMSTDKEALPRRTGATECLGLIAEALGKDLMGPLVPGIMEAAFQSMQLNDSELREYTHGTFACIAKVLGPDFVPYLQRCMDLAATSIELDDGEMVAPDEEKVAINGQLQEEPSSESIEDPPLLCAGVLDEKAAAVHAIQGYATATKAGFMPHLERAMKLVEEMANHVHEAAREMAYQAMPALLAAVADAYPSQTPGTATQQVQHVIDKTLPALIDAVGTEPDEECCMAAVTGMGAILLASGPIACQSYIERIAQAMNTVFTGGAFCQMVDSEEEPEDGEEEERHDVEVVQAAAELLPVMAEALGADAYLPIFQQLHWPPLHEKLHGSQPAGLRAALIGNLAEAAKHLQGRLQPLCGQLMPIVVRELRDSEAGNRQNAAYCAGLLAQHCPQQVHGQLGQLLQVLSPLFSQDERPTTRDNACGAVGRLILALGAHMPVDQVLPVMLGALPLREDFDEAQPVYSSLCHLATNPNSAQGVVPQVPAIVQALGAVAVQEAAPLEVRRSVAGVVQQLASQHAAQLQPVLQALPQDQQHAIHSLSSQS